jgi:hypothetical protein
MICRSADEDRHCGQSSGDGGTSPSPAPARSTLGAVPHPDGFLTIACTPETLRKKRGGAVPPINAVSGPVDFKQSVQVVKLGLNFHMWDAW